MRLVAIIYVLVSFPLISTVAFYLLTADDNCERASKKRFTTFNCDKAHTFAIVYSVPLISLLFLCLTFGIAFLCGRLIDINILKEYYIFMILHCINI